MEAGLSTAPNSDVMPQDSVTSNCLHCHRVNQFGEIDRVSYNYPSRAASMHLSAQEMKDLYQAAGIFHKMMYDSKYMIEYQLEEGDILCFHNMRILHGRTPYDATTSQRWLEGAYTSWDNLHARMRAIEEELNNSSQ